MQYRTSLVIQVVSGLIRSGFRRSGRRFIPKYFIIVVLISWLPGQSAAQNRPMDEASIESFKRRVKDVADNTGTISCDFLQEKEMSMIKEKIISRGKFYLKKEKMLRWEYIHPFSYTIVIKNDQISIRDENKVNHFNIQSNPVFLEINRVILGSIQGTLLNDDKNFMATFFENPTSWVVKLQTLSPRLKESLSEIVIWFDRKDYTINRLDMNEPAGDFTKLEFSSKKLNKPIADEMFVLH
ncbi:MAG: outer membrane lipoprotein carrier protein LolA [Bacteroidales bacterium]|nr:outer membrane lipoprotein carrier protein LolA [Bacteroidales bacterium]